MDAPNPPISQLPVTNGTASRTNGNTNVSAQNLVQAPLQDQFQPQFDAQMQPQGISAGKKTSSQAFPVDH
jgi:hypothetical protein